MVDYESDAQLAQYLLFHYGKREEILPYSFGPVDALYFPVRCAELGVRWSQKKGRALDLGCAVGRSTFELAKNFDEVIGLDASRRFIATANQLKQNGELSYSFPLEGELVEQFVAQVPSDIIRDKVTFIHGNACQLDSKLGVFDFVLMANLIDRLPELKRCLEKISSFLAVKGILLITSPYTWLETVTPKEEWLGGIKRDEKSIFTLDTLQSLLESDFELLECHDMPFLIREHARKYQWSVAEATVWRKR
ncbi:MAG: putative 4-mercaptohistidine N1-methyltransferase [Verrucomicrobiae bacterium]|nr:putative 4-mercaptohistidine N1-methyltransferase [Verrucomicrobiae bacterium]